jgi:ABC-2 type transport system ATP-binding protein
LILRLAARGVTLIVSSHILAELEDYSSDMLLISGGRVVEHRSIGAVAGAPRRFRVEFAVAAGPLRSRVADLLGIPVVIEGDRVLGLTLSGTDLDAAATLKRLIEDGLPVSAFMSHHQSMQDVYLDHLSAARLPEAAR